MEVLGIDARVEGVVSGDARDAGRQSGPSQGAITTPAALGGPPAQRDSAMPPPRPAAAPAPREAPPEHADPAPQAAATEPAVPSSRPSPSASTSDWSSAPPPSTSAPSWATGGDDPIERAPSGPLATVTPIRSEPVTPPVRTVERAVEVVDDPASISDDDEDIESSGEVGLAVVERILGGTVITTDDT